MKSNSWVTAVVAGLIGGLVVVWTWREAPRSFAAGNDRYQDYIICTGMASMNARVPTDGLWVLDYRSGKLLGTLINRETGKIVGWAETDLVTEFNIPPRQDVHFMMTTGNITAGQAALYIAEVQSGKIGVYTLGQTPNGAIAILRQDQQFFRAPPAPNNGAPLVMPNGKK